jgi:putative glutamine amidotransferase
VSVIGITVGSTELPAISNAYVKSVLIAGGTPVIIPALLGESASVYDALKRVDAVLLTGGGDIHPARYGESPRATLDGLDLQRDAMELCVVEWAIREQRRVLGICRGAQLLAVATGGSLIQDLPAEGIYGHFDNNHDRGYAELRHEIWADPLSRTHRVLSGLTSVNSHHHQAIRKPGEMLEASAWAKDGTIEAVESARLLGLQWHPEALATSDDRHLEPFRWLVYGDREEL